MPTVPAEYLTTEELNGLLYLYAGGRLSACATIGEAFELAAALLIHHGYFFRGLDRYANPILRQKSPRELRELVTGEPCPDVSMKVALEWLCGGRQFIRRVAPMLLDETDAAWAFQVSLVMDRED